MRSLGKYLTFAIVLLPASGLAAETGDPEKGLSYAKEVCADCHAVLPGQKVSPNIKAPSFGTIAHSKLVTTREIRAWLQSSHPDMPDLVIPPEKREDVIAYLKSLGE